MDRRIKIMYEDEDIIVCHKGPGIAVESAKTGAADMITEIKKHLKGGYTGMIHRLDQPVEGLVVFAKNKRAAASLSAQMKEKEMCKEYLAQVHGTDIPDKGELKDHIKRAEDGNLSLIGSADTKGAKESTLLFEKAGRCGNMTLLRIRLISGRHHQIRAQLSAAGHPIAGDRKYCSDESKAEDEALGIKNIRLCAAKLVFMHPSSGEEMEFELTPGW